MSPKKTDKNYGQLHLKCCQCNVHQQKLTSNMFFDVVVLFHLLAIADKIYGNHCAPWSVEIVIKYAFP